MVVRTIGIGRIFLTVSLVTYLLSLALNIVSFSTSEWLVYTDVSIKIGLWRICDTATVGYDKCADWNDRTYPTNLSNIAFTGPPDYVKSSQGLEIVAFIFYMITGVVLFLAFLKFSIPLLFLISAILMLISAIFLAATLGIMCDQGRTRHNGYLHFAWWIGLVGMIFTLLCGLSLCALSFYIQPISKQLAFNKMTEAASTNGIVNNGMSHYSHLNPPSYQQHQPLHLQQSSSSSYNHAPDTLSYGLMNNTSANSYPMLQHQQQYLDGQQPSTNSNYAVSAYNQPQPPVVTKLGRQYVGNQMFNNQQQPATILGEPILEDISKYIDLQAQRGNQLQGYI
ncbi:unnamed protein product [Didymodactylos carnosus]|uniref:Uncharacterized protein n=1 Tax=Didymodactylos carnosus TaxID=1234261 RepID=A0A814G568_9BILA|nr:unnamed protein product [Didymodactylos carnosus]CAF0989312.1 unnamed protein product [Didymodactylos carnosus]CAF3631390.1 unnamed protein product [Didymodactylos carnosus]CAF3761447.1 unnamed protein product [Didymodactylos carnosus]